MVSGLDLVQARNMDNHFGMEGVLVSDRTIIQPSKFHRKAQISIQFFSIYMKFSHLYI